VWSPQWSSSGTSGLILDSGDKATVTYNGTGSYVSLEGGTTAQILRSDIALENGVMHVGPHPLSLHGANGRLSIPSFRVLVESLPSQINPSIHLRIRTLINLKPLLSSIPVQLVQLVQVLLVVNYLPRLKLLDHPALLMVPLRGSVLGLRWLLRVDWYWR
jgi:hypothetical protein